MSQNRGEFKGGTTKSSLRSQQAGSTDELLR